MNLRALDWLASLGCPVGLSDHTLDHQAAILAVARGAVLIEKHFTLSRGDGGPDALFSLEPAEFTSLVDAVRDAWEALGDADILSRERRPGSEHGRSLFVVQPIAAGEAITREHVRPSAPDLACLREACQRCWVGAPGGTSRAVSRCAGTTSIEYCPGRSRGPRCPVCGNGSRPLLELAAQPIYQHPVASDAVVPPPHSVDLRWVACKDCAHGGSLNLMRHFSTHLPAALLHAHARWHRRAVPQRFSCRAAETSAC